MCSCIQLIHSLESRSRLNYSTPFYFKEYVHRYMYIYTYLYIFTYILRHYKCDCSSHFSWCCDKNTWHNNTGSQFANTIHHGRTGMVAGAYGSWSQWAHSQKTERGKCWCSVSFSLWFSLGSQPLACCHSHSGWVLPPQLKLSIESPSRHTVCLLGDS